jgi:hypothetical protein
MRGAQPDANYSAPGFLPEARFRLPHRPQENGKEINFDDELVSLISIAYLIAPACAIGEMARTFLLWRDEENDQDANWIAL